MNNKIQGAALLFSTLIILIAVLFVIGAYSHSETTHFQGIADSAETVINSESSVEIKKILVIEGQKVSAGEKLAELTNPELALRISDINNQLLQLMSEKGLDKAEIKSKLIQTQAAEQAVVNDLNAQIRSLENQIKINKELSSGLKSFQMKQNSDDLKNPIMLQIESLKIEIADRKKEFGASVQMYREMLANSDAPVKIQSERLKEELEMLTEKSSNLAIFAPFEGIIGNVYFKGGEKTAPFTPILSILQKEPSIVKGYIHESLYSQIKAGDTVTVVSIDGKKKISGVVAGLGNRIVPYPVRLLKLPNFQLWGREITVKIPESNGFILGEKVTIIFETARADSFFSKLLSFLKPAELSAKETGSSFDSKEIKSDESVKIEASGAIFIKNINLFAVISDETEKKTPFLFLMDKTGAVKEKIKIEGLEKIDDVESIAMIDNANILISSSLSYSQKGELKDHRKILASVKLENKKAVMTNSVDLYALLSDLARSGKGELNRFLSMAISEKTMDIEGMSVVKNALFIAFKNPLLNKKPVILKIADFMNIFKTKNIESSQVSFSSVASMPENERISDIYNSDDQFYFTTSCNNGRCGGFYKLADNKAVLLKRFETLKPEGIAFDGNFYIFFDEGGHNNSRFMEIKR